MKMYQNHARIIKNTQNSFPNNENCMQTIQKSWKIIIPKPRHSRQTDPVIIGIAFKSHLNIVKNVPESDTNHENIEIMTSSLTSNKKCWKGSQIAKLVCSILPVLHNTTTLVVLLGRALLAESCPLPTTHMYVIYTIYSDVCLLCKKNASVIYFWSFLLA